MKINKSNKFSKKMILVLITIVILLAVATLSFYVYIFKGSLFGWSPTNQSNKSSINYDKPTDQQRLAGENIKESSISKSDTNGDPKEQFPDPSTAPVTITILRAGQVANADHVITGQPVSVRAIVSDNSSGKCIISFLLPGQPTVSKTVDIVPQSTYFSCAAIDVPTGEFGISGTWQVTAHIMSGDSAISNVASMSIEVKK